MVGWLVTLKELEVLDQQQGAGGDTAEDWIQAWPLASKVSWSPTGDQKTNRK